MSEEVLINVTQYETRVAIVENGVLQEVHVERTNKLGLVGNIYKGKVVRVLPGMQAAFIDIGLPKAAFLHTDDIYSSDDNLKDSKSIDLASKIKENQEIIVQVIKDPISNKGARLTTQLSVSSRALVFMPNSKHIGVSLRIEDENERQRLKELLSPNEKELEGGYIIRTAAEGYKSFEDNIEYLKRTWESISKRISKAKFGDLIHEEHSLVHRSCRDFLRPSTDKIRIDQPEYVHEITDFISKYIPKFAGSIEFYDSMRPIFDYYGIEDEINRAIQSKIPLKSGGYLIFDLTEAMTVIDVNTGAFVGRKNLEETIFKTNLEAAVSIARQLRLRNIGGIIIVDFIDMCEEEHQRQILRTLEKEIIKDLVKVKISEITSLGLVQITRKRTRESLEHVLCEECNVCSGHGVVKTAETVCYEIFREIIRADKTYDSGEILVIASEKVIERLIDEESNYLAGIEDITSKTVKFQVESLYKQEQYDVVSL
ncbi:MAG: ribonuclease G [Francisellaceae bacterium]|jgi:ribonuclease G|nr:ribonuclease G [Francisellaceae bacterium]MBT6539755.1 ribonuclease G [Francisellaceae bacterium]